MAENSIDLVREAEAQAEQQIRAAQQEADKARQDAHEEARRRAQQALDAAGSAADDAQNAAKEDGRLALEKADVELDAELAALQMRARANQPEAIRIILESLA